MISCRALERASRPASSGSGRSAMSFGASRPVSLISSAYASRYSSHSSTALFDFASSTMALTRLVALASSLAVTAVRVSAAPIPIGTLIPSSILSHRVRWRSRWMRSRAPDTAVLRPAILTAGSLNTAQGLARTWAQMASIAALGVGRLQYKSVAIAGARRLGGSILSSPVGTRASCPSSSRLT